MAPIPPFLFYFLDNLSILDIFYYIFKKCSFKISFFCFDDESALNRLPIIIKNEDLGVKLSHIRRDFYNRLRAASKTQFLSDIINIGCITYIIYVGIILARAKLYDYKFPSNCEIWAFYFASVYTILHRSIFPYFFKKSKKWSIEHIKRHQKFATANIKLTNCLQQGSLKLYDIMEIENGYLNAMLSNVEEEVVDIEGIYLNITLIMENPKNINELLSVNRANKERPCKSYNKKNMLAWKAMESGKRQYNPDFQAN